MIDITIKAETQDVADAAKLFLTTYKEQVVGFTNQVLQAQGAQVDAGLKVIDDTIVIYQMNPDKGFVLGEVKATEGEASIAVMKYPDLPDGQRYVTIEGDRIFLFLKEPQGTPDPKIGAFKTLNDAVTEFNSQSVKDALKNYADKKAAQEKTAKRDENRLARLNGSKGELAIASSAELSEGPAND
jgi:hypothetical protein